MPHPPPSQGWAGKASLSSPICKVAALDWAHSKAPSSLICGKPWPPNPMRSQGSLMALLSSAQGHTVPLVSAVWTVPGGHWASRGPCCAIYKRQKSKPRGRGCRELGQFAGLSSPGLYDFRGRLPALTGRLSLSPSVFEGPPPGPRCHSEGPPRACLWVWALWEVHRERAPPLPKHVNPLLTKRKGFQGPSGLGEGGGGWGCPVKT